MDLRDELYKELLKKVEYLCKICEDNNIDNNMFKIYKNLDNKLKDSETKEYYENCKDFLEKNTDICEIVEDIINKIGDDNEFMENKDNTDKTVLLNIATSIVKDYIMERCNYEFKYKENINKENLEESMIYYFNCNENIDCDKYCDLIQAGFIAIYFTIQKIYL